MNKELNYVFKRKTENYFDWLGNHIKNIRYDQTEAIIVEKKSVPPFRNTL